VRKRGVPLGQKSNESLRAQSKATAFLDQKQPACDPEFRRAAMILKIRAQGTLASCCFFRESSDHSTLSRRA